MRSLAYCTIIILNALVHSVSVAETPRTNHALLIGISDYSISDGVDSLMGPPNDVALVRDVLKTRFGLKDENIVTLLQQQATHSAIQTAFADLAASAKEGDFIYIHYSGHGSTRENRNERGGYDQTWVTYGSRNKNVPAPNNRDVLDKEINLWLQPLYKKAQDAAQAKKAPIDIVFVSDSCHSGTVARHVGDQGVTNVREVKPDPVPYPPVILTKSFASLPGVRIGAARDTESAVELDPRNGSACRDPHYCNGAFTWNWVKALYQAKPGDRWDDVFKRTSAMVTADRYSAQRPQQEGHSEQPIFAGTFPEPTLSVPVVSVDLAKRIVRLGAGAAANVTKGSLYRLYTGTNQSHSGDVELEVTDASDAATSEAKVRSGTVEVGDLFIETQHAYQFNPVRLFVSGDFVDDLDQPLIEDVQAAVKQVSGFQLVSHRGQADLALYVLRPNRDGAGRYGYTQSSGQRLPQSHREQPPEVWMLTPQDHVLHDTMRISFNDKQEGLRRLQKNLRAFAWTREIKQLNAGGNVPNVRVEVSLLRTDMMCVNGCLTAPDDTFSHKTPYRKLASHVLNDPHVIVERGDAVTFSIRNEDDNRSWYVYLLNIAPDGKVFRIFPTKYTIQDDARLKHGERIDLATNRWLYFTEPGLETIKLIASSDPIDVRLLENEEGFRAMRELNPLERLLKSADRRRGDFERATVGNWGTLQADYEVLEH